MKQELEPTRELKNDLRYLKDLIDANKEMAVLLEHLFWQKATACIWHSYDSQACETYCNHEEVSKEVYQLEVCPVCSYYEVSWSDILDLRPKVKTDG